MSGLLRKDKSTIGVKANAVSIGRAEDYEGDLSSVSTKNRDSKFFPSFKKSRRAHRLKYNADLNAVTRIASVQEPERNLESVSQLNQRLRLRASTFSLRTWSRRSPVGLEPQLLEDRGAITSGYRTATELPRPSPSSVIYREAADTVLHLSPTNSTACTTNAAIQVAQSASLNKPLPLIRQTELAPQHPTCLLHSSCGSNLPTTTELQPPAQVLHIVRPEQHHIPTGFWLIMAGKNAPPPLPYERLKDITTSACDQIFNSVSSYNHSLTESWNTQIINKILSQLVSETTPSPPSDTESTSTKPRQPKYKYVVNSTIIQHRSASASSAITNGADDTVAGTLSEKGGRRGMHSASGAFWDNNQDGMWSFKYEAAEAKGLDVVVGIVWVWVG